MVRRIILGLLLVGLVAVFYVGYKAWSARRAMLSGEVTAGPSEPLPAGSPATSPVASPAPAPEPRQKPYPAADSAALSNQSSAPAPQASVPATDSQPPDAPNGARFAGTGRFEVYRQGNLTYRIDTQTGTTCILFATHAEWRKPEVYRQGCNTPKS